MKLKSVRALAVALIIIGSLTGEVNAAVVFDNATTTDTSGGFFTHDIFTAFDSFTLNNTTVGAIQLEMSAYLSSISEISVDVGIWTDVNSGSVFSQTFDLSTSALATYSLLSSGDYDLYSIVLDITDIALDGSYWLSVYTTGVSGGGLLVPFSSTPVDGDDSFIQYNSGVEELLTGRDLSFELYDAIPEPATGGLMVLISGGLFFTRRFFPAV